MPLSLIITIIGPPGSGKGTQGALIAKKYNLNYIVAGNLIRNLAKMNTPLGDKVRINYNKGIPQPDEIIIDAFKTEMSKMVMKNGFLFDTFPLSIGQAKALDEILKSYNLPENIVFYLDISADTVIKRISSRLICSKCSVVFLPGEPGYNEKKCNACGGELITRSDDKPEVVRVRIEEYKSRMRDLKDYYAQRNRLIVINGEGTIAEISKDIFNRIDGYFKAKPLNEKRGK